jgi:hypothetical protein
MKSIKSQQQRKEQRKAALKKHVPKLKPMKVDKRKI